MSRPITTNNFAVKAQIEELRREREESADPMDLVRGAYRQAINEAEARRKMQLQCTSATAAKPAITPSTRAWISHSRTVAMT
jgi:hypothetical protein